MKKKKKNKKCVGGTVSELWVRTIGATLRMAVVTDY